MIKRTGQTYRSSSPLPLPKCTLLALSTPHMHTAYIYHNPNVHCSHLPLPLPKCTLLAITTPTPKRHTVCTLYLSSSTIQEPLWVDAHCPTQSQLPLFTRKLSSQESECYTLLVKMSIDTQPLIPTKLPIYSSSCLLSKYSVYCCTEVFDPLIFRMSL